MNKLSLFLTVYLVLSANVYIYLRGINPKNTQASIPPLLHMDTKPLCFSCIVSVRRITASYFFDKAPPAVINPSKEGSQWFNTTLQRNSTSVSICFPFRIRLMVHVCGKSRSAVEEKRPQSSRDTLWANCKLRGDGGSKRRQRHSRWK